jgi:hypothetical protein
MIQRIAEKFLQDCIERDPVVRYRVRGIKLSEWQEQMVRDTEKQRVKPYLIVMDELYVPNEKTKMYEPFKFGENT